MSIKGNVIRQVFTPDVKHAYSGQLNRKRKSISDSRPLDRKGKLDNNNNEYLSAPLLIEAQGVYDVCMMFTMYVCMDGTKVPLYSE